MNLGLVLVVALAMMDSPPNKSNALDPGKPAGRRTLGGKQFWTDFLVLHQWRIQQNGATGHYRLLNSHNRAMVSGSFETCKKRFDNIRARGNFPAINPQIVVTIHGLGRSRSSMESIGKHIQDQNGYTWINFGYASTRNDIKAHAQALRSAIDFLAAVAKENAEAGEAVTIHFVGHSLGNIVVRSLLHETSTEENLHWTVGRIVMLAPPNKGSAMASLLKKSKAFKVIAGKSGTNLAVEWNTIEKQLATPSVEFGIIAGGRGNRRGYNPLLKGDDDLIVSVEETRLTGATDFHVFPSMHTYIMNKQDVQVATSRFLAKGFFFSPEKRNPIKD